MNEQRHTELEDRLRAAFTAQADAVTPRSLSPAAPPVRARRVQRWVFPTLAGVAVAAASAGIVAGVATSGRTVTALPPAATATPTAPTVSPTPAPVPSTTPPPLVAPTPQAPTTSPPASSPSSSKVSQTVTAAGWKVSVPSAWQDGTASTNRDADTLCLGPNSDSPCLVRLVAAANVGKGPDPRLLGGGIVHDLAGLSCQAGDASELGLADGGTAGVIPFTCGSERYQQLWFASRNLLVVAAQGNTAVDKALRTLRVDFSYPSFRRVKCQDVALKANSDKVATAIEATGLSCGETTGFVRAIAAKVNVYSGPATVRAAGFTCTIVRDPGETLPSARITCHADDGSATIFYTQN